MKKKPTNHTKKCPHCNGTGKVFHDELQGQQLKKERGRMRQIYVARALGITSGYLSQLESGVRSWDFEKVKRYRKALTTKPKTKTTK